MLDLTLSYDQKHYNVSGHNTIILQDNLNGFDLNYRSSVLDELDIMVNKKNINVLTSYIVNQQVKDNYQNFNFSLDFKYLKNLYNGFSQHRYDVGNSFINFLCSFNGSMHVSRCLLVAILKKFGFFNPDYVSKGFSFELDKLDGYIQDYVGGRDALYRKWFISDDSEDFFQKTNSIGSYLRFDHANNINQLKSQLTNSFVHLVSESMATSYHPFIGEKFLYSVVTKGLFVAYGQPGWHSVVEKYYGFRSYNKLFDYRFDEIMNPIERLVELVVMISKFSKLSPAEWHDLYCLENDTIEYNYDHYYSGDYLRCLSKFSHIDYVD